MAALEQVSVKRVYDSPSKSDGTRVLVDRLWPRGLTKADAKIDLWLRDLSPSNELREWLHSHPDHWPEFRKKYFEELQSTSAAAALNQLHDIVSTRKPVTLVFASRNTDQNNATVLKEFIENRGKAVAPGTLKSKNKRR